MSARPWRFIERRQLAATRVHRLYEERWHSPRVDREHTFSILDAADWVNVIPLDRDQRMVLIRQFRFGTRRFTLELPGGAVDAHEDPQTAAQRELREETGYQAERLVSLGTLEPNPAIFSNRMHVFVAEGCQRQFELMQDEGEDIEVVPIDEEQVLEMVCKGEIFHALMVAALFRFRLYRDGKLRLGGMG
jgi:ADP-ribose pyrophosphatase